MTLLRILLLGFALLVALTAMAGIGLWVLMVAIQQVDHEERT